MRKLFAAAALLGLSVFSAPRAEAVSYTLKQLVEGNLSVSVGDLTFSNFGLGMIGLGGDTGAVLTSLGYAPDGSEVTIDFVQVDEKCVELRYSAFDITVIGNGGPLSINGNVAFDYTVTCGVGGIYFAGESGAFGAVVAPPTVGGAGTTNVGTGSFTTDFGGNGSITMAGAKTNTGVNIGFTPDALNFNPSVTTLEAHKDLFVNLVLQHAQAGAIYNIHVSDYVQEYCCDVPEPGTMAFLVAAGAFGILFRVRRK